MLCTIGLLLLLTPLPSFQTTTSAKGDLAGSGATKAAVVLTLSKPRPTATLIKRTLRPTLKLNTGNQTVLSTPAINQKPAAVNATVTTKRKINPVAIQTTPSPAVKAITSSGSIPDKDKPTASINVTVTVTKSFSASDGKNPKDSPVSSVAASNAANDKDKVTVSASQSAVTKAQASTSKTNKDKLHPLVSRTVSEVRGARGRPASAGVKDVQSTPTNSASASGAKATKDKFQPLVNHTASVKSPLGSEVKDTKHKPAPTAAPDVQSTPTKSPSPSGAKTTKENHQPSVNQTILEKLPSGSDVRDTKHKPAPTAAPDVQSTPTTLASATGAKTIKEKLTFLVNHIFSVQSHPAGEGKSRKDKPAPTGASDVQTTSRASASASGVKTSKEKLQPLVNHTISVKSASDEGTSKDKPVHTAVQNVQSTSTDSAPASGKTTKNKLTASVNQTVVAKSPSASDVENPDTALSTSAKVVTASGSAADKDILTASVNHTTVVKPPTTTKEKPSVSQPIQVLISNGCDSSNAKEQELKLQPGAPLVMTHKISLVPGGCTGACEAEMAALIGRVARLEREMSLLKEKCPCSGNCPDDCSGNGECEKGKCVCHQGFTGSDCSKCAQGAECGKKVVKDTTKETKLEKEAEQVNKNKGSKKASTTAKPDTNKSQATQETPSNSSREISHHEHEKQKHELVSKDKTTAAVSKNDQRKDPKIGKEDVVGKKPKSNELKDEPHSNVTQSNGKKSNGTGKTVTALTKGVGTNKTRTGKETQEQSEGNVTQSPRHKHSKTDKDANTDAGETGKEKTTQGSQHAGNATITSASHAAHILQNKTTTHGSKVRRGMRGSGLGSVKVGNISSNSFTLTWLAPKGMFKNFTVVRTEPRLDGDEDDPEELEEEALRGEKTSIAKNSTEVHVQTEGAKTGAKKGKANTKRISIVVPGGVRSVEFSNLRANTRYDLKIYGTGAEKQSKIHTATAVTGPEPATDIVFSNVTESSLTVSWSKPKSTFTGFMVSYTNIMRGQRHLATVAPGQSHAVLSKLSAGSSYVISVTTTRGRAQSDALTSVITTVPAPPTHLQAVNVTDTRALLQWTPSLGKVDRFIITYESSKTPNVTVTVMLTGNSVEHQLRGLQRGTMYTVKVLSQKDSLQSTAISTTFTTADVVKAREVGPRSAVIMWKTPAVAYQSYRVIYQVAGEKKKEVVLEPTITEYKLTGLLPMSRYVVVVQGEREAQYTSLVTTEFITGKLHLPFPTECSQELLNGAVLSGEVDIYPQGKEGQAVRVYCDMETDGGGWTVFQRRMNGKIDFYRNWSDYRAGFGNLSEEFWLGNEALHSLTSVGPVSLRVDMRSGNDSAYAYYTNFSVDSEKRHYALTVSGFTGTAGDSLKYHNGRPFSTWDKDPQSLGIHCAKAYTGGWWYKNCYKTNLNGRYGTNSNNQGIVWIDWKGKDFSIPFIEMKFRPSTFSPATHG